eukprot:363330-Chlamydomonas_euryale.AAC.10
MALKAAKPAAPAQAVWRVAGEGNANIVLTYCGDDPVLVSRTGVEWTPGVNATSKLLGPMRRTDAMPAP